MELDLLQIARDLIRANTVSSRGNAGAVGVLAPLYRQLGWKVDLLEGPESTAEAPQHNLLARAPGGEGDGLLAVTHLDTVDPGPRELWSSDPFELTGDERVVGLGAADVKIDAACKLLAFSRLADATLARPLAFAGTYMEEVGCRGARELARTRPFPARFVTCGEPSELRIIDAHKGYAVVRITITDGEPQRLEGKFRKLHVLGKAAHSSTPHLGKNAILEAWPQLQRVARIEAGSVANKVPAELHALVEDPNGSESVQGHALDWTLHIAHQLWMAWALVVTQTAPEPNPRFSPSEAVSNWGVLASDGPNLTLTFDARLLPGQSPKTVLERFEGQLATLRKNQPRFAIAVRADRANEAMQLARPSELLDAAQATATALGLNPEPQAKPTNTEAGVFASAGCEAIVFGPGVSTNNAHCANEYQLVSQCKKAIEFYEALARRLCVRA